MNTKKPLLGLALGSLAFGGLYAAAPYAVVVAPNKVPGGAYVEALRRARYDLRHKITRRAHTTEEGISISYATIGSRATNNPPERLVLLLHGIRSDHSLMFQLADAIADTNALVIAPDLRGHGSSTGDYITYGAEEHRDISSLITALLDDHPNISRVAIVGYSFGGAVAIQTAAADERVDRLVTISTFSHIRAVTEHYTKHYLPGVGHLFWSIAGGALLERASSLCGVDLEARSSVDAARDVNAPTLMIHGTHDRKIPVQHARELANAFSDRPELIEVFGAGHDDIIRARTRDYVDALISWISA